jgi:hypothetical protein
MIRRVAEAAVSAYISTSSPLAIAERLFLLGPAVVRPLERFVESNEKSEKRTLASILLLSLGSKQGLEDVLHELEVGGPDEILAARKLVDANVKEAPGLIIERLRRLPATAFTDQNNAPYVNGLLGALANSGTPLPDEIKKLITPT